jgi:hypothetical protein
VGPYEIFHDRVRVISGPGRSVVRSHSAGRSVRLVREGGAVDL